MPSLLLLCLLVTSFISGSLLAYPLHQIMGGSETLAFHKLIGHCIVLSGLLLSFLYLRYFNLLNKRGMGFDLDRNSFIKQILAGFVYGCLILIIIELILIALGIHGPELDRVITVNYVAWLFFKSLLAAMVIAFLEETIFRGCILSALAKTLPSFLVILITAATYSAVHFVKIPAVETASVIQWYSGLILLTKSFTFFNLNSWDTFLTLFFLGVLLAQIRITTGNIALCIGIHAGLIVVMKVSRKLTDYIDSTRWEFLVNNTDHQLGLLATLVLIGVSTMYYFVKMKR